MSRTLKQIFLRIFLVCICCQFSNTLCAQKNAAINYILAIHYKDSIIKPAIVLQNNFSTLSLLYDYVNDLPKLFTLKGFPVASVDSIWVEENTTHIILYTGKKYNWLQLTPKNIEKNILIKVGFISKNFNNRVLKIGEVDILKERLLHYYENAGYPFATIYLDSISIEDNKMNALLVADKNILYHIDSIVNYGKLTLNKKFLQNYTGIKNNSIYSKEKLQQLDKRMADLPFAETIQPSSLNMLGSGSVVNLYVNQRRSSQVSAIFGLLPNANSGKFQFTGDVNLDLKNVLGGGEGLLFKYQALQPKSPRLNIGFDKPFIFQSPFGLGFLFDLFKKDSSFLSINAQAAVQLNLTANQTGKILLQTQSTSLLQGGIDTNIIKSQKKLPDNIDVKAINVGLNYEYYKTDYRFNPRSGTEVNFTAITGIKNIQKNSDIIALKSGSFNFAGLYDTLKLRSYQLKIKVTAAHYFPVAKLAAIKIGLNTGIYNSPEIFRNEVFQIGGYKLLRGFDEESIYATQYGVFTVEYRYLLGRNSYLFGFIDAAFTKTTYQRFNTSNRFVGSGAGILYDTKSGLLNISIALGTRDDVPFNLRGAAKIHFGYINYF